ncbi:hypothetical protein E2C01_078681 [Portunus trituberculatus]|uniref:Uncharacterized protein n=1 Tax=Portunus trituberculatus TaxID=210409 RepID=A0A5B7ITE9_PORTR|nr:hypothetical protein [Portunus trituberculatus]
MTKAATSTAFNVTKRCDIFVIFSGLPKKRNIKPSKNNRFTRQPRFSLRKINLSLSLSRSLLLKRKRRLGCFLSKILTDVLALLRLYVLVSVLS